jgi:hypothetical protein
MGCASARPPRGSSRESQFGCAWDTLVNNMVEWHVRDVEGVFKGAIRTLAKAGGLGAKVTGTMDGTDLETTERYAGCGQVPRTVRIEGRRGQVDTIEVTGYGWKVPLLIDAVDQYHMGCRRGRRFPALPLRPHRWPTSGHPARR